MVLDHIAGDPDAIEVSGPTADADVFGHGDLDMVDVVVVPHRLEEFVGEPQRQHVLHSLLAKIVIDAEHRGGREDAGARSGSVPERWRDRGRTVSRSPPGSTDRAAARPGHASVADRRRSGTAPAGWIGRTRDCRRCRAPRRDRRSSRPGGRRIPRCRSRQARTGCLRKAAARPLLGTEFAHAALTAACTIIGEVLVRPVSTGEPDQREARWQQTAVGQVIDRRHELLG